MRNTTMKKFRIPPCKNHSLSPMAIKMGSATASPLLRTIQPVTQKRNQVLGLNIVFTKSFGVVVVREAKAER